MPDEIHLDPVDLITIGTIGPPGQRVFHLQARQGSQLLTLTIEKEQAAALAEGIMSLLKDIEKQFELKIPDINIADYDLDLQEPILPLFRVANMGLGYDDQEDRLVLLANELLPEDEPNEPRIVRMIATREQLRALAEHTLEVVSAGRPICGHCGRPIDPDGHFCPGSNGHRRDTIEDSD